MEIIFLKQLQDTAGLLGALAFPKKLLDGKAVQRETHSKNFTALCARDKGLVWSYREEKECLCRERCCKIGTGAVAGEPNEARIHCGG